MNLKTKILILPALLVALSSEVRADLIDMGEGAQGPNSSTATETGLANAFFTDTFEFLYRFPTGEGDYDAYFTITDNGDGSADVSWDLTGTGKGLFAVGVKSGSESIHWYGVTADQHVASGSIQEVTAPDEIDSISHISFFGKDFEPNTEEPPNGEDPPPTSVPDAGATALLLGLALPGLMWFRSRKR